METKKEHWMDHTLNSTNGLKRVGISADLRKRLEAIPTEVELFNKTIPMSAIWLAAASLALLFIVNFATVKHVKSSEKKTEKVYDNYFSYLEQL